MFHVPGVPRARSFGGYARPYPGQRLAKLLVARMSFRHLALAQVCPKVGQAAEGNAAPNGITSNQLVPIRVCHTQLPHLSTFSPGSQPFSPVRIVFTADRKNNTKNPATMNQPIQSLRFPELGGVKTLTKSMSLFTCRIIHHRTANPTAVAMTPSGPSIPISPP